MFSFDVHICGERLVWSSCQVSLLVQVPHGVCDVQYGCGAMWSDYLIDSAILLPLVSVNLEYQDEWCALKSSRIMVSCVISRCSIEN